MPAPPEKKKKNESSTISMVVEEWERGQTEQFSAVHRIKGYPWRLRLCTHFGSPAIELLCDKSNEAELWMCAATIKPFFNSKTKTHSFNSWDKSKLATRAIVGRVTYEQFKKGRTVGAVLEVEVEVDIDGKKWNHPTLDPLEPLDGILVIGNEKINVNKASLAAQSSYFDNLFFGSFKEKDMTEITIEDVDYEEFSKYLVDFFFQEFSNLLKIIYRHDGRSLTDENVCRVLHHAVRFDLKIVESVCTNYLLSTSSSLSIHEKLLIAEEYNLPFLKENIIASYTEYDLKVLVDSPDWGALSKETTQALMKKCLSMVRFSESYINQMFV